MIGKWLIKAGQWIESRFPNKIVVTWEDWIRIAETLSGLETQVDLLRDELNTLKASHAATIDRVSHVEASAVHKGAVKELVDHVKTLKDEQVAMKANLGWGGTPTKVAALEAMLNGEMISNGE